ncbi:hypothetical protein NFX46_14970 [Streptomyces phaeoluteigriseus]|uniref:DUF6745 domain-containing protein n=1 Tax=Streptomyces phaeoluteigriseus TaxID=114686 RepID=A0ABY4Z8E7_9ACTN|nr:hypothetical protein [Streptomyces phaeoluteigriseus]USQ84975.1 hypothetical protein NFX46_14970 [Streptomyces phaeoluteigriseus]
MAGTDGTSATGPRSTDGTSTAGPRGTAVGDVGLWAACAAAAVPADRVAAEAGVRRAYRRAGLAEPEQVLWAASPREAVTLIRALDDRGPSVREAVRTAPWARERARLHAELGPAGWAAHWAATGGRLWETTQVLVERIRRGVLDEMTDGTGTAGAGPGTGTEARTGAGTGTGTGTGTEARTGAGTGTGTGTGTEARTGAGTGGRAAEAELRLLLLDAVLGQHDAPWLAAFPTDREPLDGLAAVCRNAGWWWPFARVAVVCERPVALHRDEAGRLDRGDGPALAYPDGFALYAWRGMPVPAAFLAELTALTPDRIRAEENAELRRVMLEHYGYDRYLADSGARPLHRDETGTLWRIDLVGDEPVVMVEVLNSTPEPDGTRRTYWLRVPPSTRTAREGVAWTFGLRPDVYAPVRET